MIFKKIFKYMQLHWRITLYIIYAKLEFVLVPYHQASA